VTDPHAAEVARSVRAFYEEMPFNLFASAGADADGLRTNVLPGAFPDLHDVLSSGEVRSVLDVGCGAGWLANTIALHYGIPVVGVDFTERAVERARGVAEALGTERLVRFRVADLFAVEEVEADLVASVGVLHHTHDARGAFLRIQRMAGPKGFVHLGLYHRHGRQPFLDLLRGVLESDGEDAAFRRYRELDGARRGDDTLLRSWFRDQVLHPHESLHTLREVAAWLRDAGFEVRSTSVNGFAAFERVEDLFAIEPSLAEVSRRANCVERRMFPGFFTVLARRTGAR
jgi:cyclopropane fatty-acyl-phospholipid synthase-like methyltransferase